ncbi:uncharacterized protein LOC127639456 [Xyrauchen texanus]|uniref:uncharacterized protein LOC127639456 n=1 Tax=Xyrauchen texanus TaxID=154827 RepID=UPI0022419E02|nr:uncharacterized protein LOC127639456 [Xyrauchen texanus]
MSLPEEQRERPDSPVFSSVSVKSDRSKGEVPNFSEETPSKRERPDSPVFSSVSVKSDQSKGEVPNFSEETPSKSGRPDSPVFSSVSVKSDQSKGEVPNFSEETPSKSGRPDSPVSSSVSLKSDQSKGEVPNFSEETPSKRERAGSHVSSYVSVKSDRSKGEVPNFSEETPSATKRVQHDTQDSYLKIHRRRKDFKENILWIFQDLENKIITFLKNELERFKKIMKKENTQYFVTDFKEDRYNIKEAALDITLYFLRSMKENELADTLEDELVFIHQRQLKSNLIKKYQCVLEGIAKHGDSTLLNKIYTDLYITQGSSEQVNTEHEVRQMEKASRQTESPEIQIKCTNLFKHPGQDKEIRTVLTKGVAGIGKSVSVQKFVLDWAEGKENQDISFIFPLPFREMNLKENDRQSLMDLISQFFPETKGLNLARNDKFKVLFVLDGLDECRLPLKFEGNETWRDVTSPAPLDVLLTNLIKGNLLPSAHIWITTRPAAASKIPPEFTNLVAEVRGFSDEQKEEYFKKRFTDENLGNTIIDHIKTSKSLFIMCHIPVFCWISATVLQNILEKKINNKSNQTDDTPKTLQESGADDGTPKTLTQMYTHFFRFQIQQSSRKYDGKYSPDISWNKEAILSLGKLAFQQLERNNLIFYGSDLEACGIDLSKASVYSGMCTQIFKEETGIVLGTMYCFVHMSIQEFIASLYAHLFLDTDKKNAFSQDGTEQEHKNETMIDLLKTAVDKALASDNGHLDLFLRFLLGLSLESNRSLLRGLLTQQDSNEQSKKEIVEYIKQKFEDNASPERSINLFYCLNELNDQTLVKEIQNHLREGSLSSAHISPAQWSALAFVLLTSEEELEEFDLQKFKKSDECLCRLVQVVKTAKRALLNDCDLTDKSCSALSTVLGSDTNLKELNMHNNNLQDSGVKQLCTGLESKKCKLEKLSLSKCEITEESCSALATVLSSDSSNLRELDLSNNNLQDSGVKLLSDGLQNNCTLEILRISNCSITEEGYKALSSAVLSNLYKHLIELDLRGNDPGESGVKLLTDLLKDTNCKLKLLKNENAERECESLTSVLGINPLFLSELNVNGKDLEVKLLPGIMENPMCNLRTRNFTSVTHSTDFFPEEKQYQSQIEVGDSEVKQLSLVMDDSHSKLKKLRLEKCDLTKESCSALATVLSSDSSSLRELDLSNNKLQDSGVKLLSDGLQSNSKLETLILSECSITEEGYKSLSSALKSNPTHLLELNLRGNDPGESGVKLLTDLLLDTNYKLRLRFLKNEAAEKTLEYWSTVLGENPLLRRELNLSEYKLEDSKVNQLTALLEDKHCKLNKLILNNSCITEEGCAALAKALILNPSNLKELDLSLSKLGDSGIKKICTLFENKECRLMKLKFNYISMTEEGCAALTSSLNLNPSYIRELELSGNKLGDSGVEKICSLLENSQCQLEKLRLSDCNITEEGYIALSSALNSNPSHLIELNLIGNDPGESGVKLLYDLLQDPKCKLNTLKLCNCSLTENDFVALTSALNSNPSHLKKLDLCENKLGDSGVNHLCALLKNSHCTLEKLKLSMCKLTEESCSALATVLISASSSLIELDMSKNDLKDSGMKQLCTGLENSQSKLEILRLSDCSIMEEGYKALSSALRSNLLHLIELDLCRNDPGESGVELLYDLLQDTNCKLNTLKLLSPSAEEACQYLSSVLQVKYPLLLRELNLNGQKLEDSKVNQLAALLEDKHCKINKLLLSDCGLSEKICSSLATVISLNSSLKELDISNNNLLDSGVKKLQKGLENTNCKLEKLRVPDCGITEEGYKALSLALRSNPSHLLELDLRGNYPGESGVKLLWDLLQDKNYKLNTLKFLKSSAAEEACKYLSDVVGENPLLLKELNLSNNKLGDLDGEKLSALLMDSHSKLEKIKLNNCDLTEKSCSALSTVLSSDTVLREIDLNNSPLMDSGVKQICEGLKNPHCKLNRLKLSDCSITGEGYSALASALISNPSHLIELDLRGNDPGESGVKLLYDLLQDTNYKLNTLKLLQSSSAEQACQYLTEVLKVKNPLLLRELKLSGHKLEDSRVNQLAALLEDKHCKLNKLLLSDCGLSEKSCSSLATVITSNSSLKELDISNNNLLDSGVKKLQKGLENANCKLEKLRLSDCSITGEGYSALASALISNPSHLIELDLRGNDPGESGVKLLYDLLQDTNFKLNTLKLLQSSSAEEACQYLTKVLKVKNPLLLRELKLSGHKLEDSRVNQLTALLEDKHCKLNKLLLSDCGLSEKSCSSLATVITSNSSLKELDISNNNLLDSGVKKLQKGLENTSCKLEKLRVSYCGITEGGYKALSLALRSNPSHLLELDLRGNYPGESGVKLLWDLLQDKNYKLNTLKFLKSSAAEEACKYLSEVVGENPLLLKELDLSNNKLGDLDGEKLSALLIDSHSKLVKIKLNNCNLTEKSCSALATVLSSDTVLKEIDLNNSSLMDSGVKQICEGLKNPQCKLNRLKLSNCSISEEGYKALSSALKSNPLHLIELDLRGNDPGKSGVKLFYDLQKNPNCKLKLRFLKSSASEEACKYLSKVVGVNPLLLKELDLSHNKLGDLDEEKFSALLMDSHSKLEKVKLNNCDLTEKSCSTLVTILSSDTTLKEIDLNNSSLMDAGVKQISEGLKNPLCKLNILKLSKCELTEESCSALAAVLCSDSSSLRELELSNNNLQDSGVKLFSDGLKCNCKLETLRFSNCSITEEGYKTLTSALKSNLSHLKELDVSGNDPGQSGVELLCNIQEDRYRKLETLRFLKSTTAEEAYRYFTKDIGKNPLLLKELNLSGHKLGDSRVKQLAALLEDKHCKLNKLLLNNNCITEECCGALVSAFNSNPSNLKELDLSGNIIRNSGMNLICDLLGNPRFRLEKLKMSECSITEEGYKSLASALKSNPTHLIELDLRGNDPGGSGVKLLYELLQDKCCKLRSISFLKSSAAEEACEHLKKVLNKNPLLLKELNLSHNKIKGFDELKLSDLLKDSHSKLEKIMLSYCDLTEKSCSALASVLSSDTTLKGIDLNNSPLKDSGVKRLCEGLMKSQCKLNRLNLSNCSITEEGYKALSSALKSNPSHLIELDLRGNDPGQSGVKLLYDLSTKQNCNLRLRLLQSSSAEEACEYLTSVLHGVNPLLLRELNLCGHKLEDSRVKQIAALLEDNHCKLNKLLLNNNCISVDGCNTVVSALNSNPSNLKELNMSGNKLGNSGVMKISTLLKNTQVRLEKLELSDCSITEGGYKALSSALRSNPSYLKELDLSGNDPGESGVELLYDLLQDKQCQLNTLRLLKSPSAEEAHQYLTKTFGKNPLILREWNLNGYKLGDSKVKHLAALLEDKHCKLNILQLNNNCITEESCGALVSAFNSNPSNLKELDLSGNIIRNSGMEKICSLLRNPQFILEKLKLSDCSITEEGYKALASALRSNPTHLIELELRGNDPGESGVKLLYDLLQDEYCKLKFIRFLKSSAAEEACEHLKKVLDRNPLLLKELNLSHNKIKGFDELKLFDLLKDSHSKLEKIMLSYCDLTEKSCSALASVLSSDTILKEIDLNNSPLKDSGVKRLCEGLKKSQCKLNRLNLSNCSITEEGYKALSSALRLNPSHLIELDLRGNDPGQSGVELLYDLIEKPHCNLRLRLLQSSSAEEANKYLTSVLHGVNPLLLRELNLSEHKLEDSKVKQIAALLEDNHCKLNKLQLNNNCISVDGCNTVLSALISNPSNLKELNMSGNKLGNSGVIKISTLLKNTQVRLEKLELSDCSITEEGYKALSSALNSNPSYLIELDLSGNDPGESGVELLYDLLQDKQCQLNTLRLLKSPAEEAHQYLTKEFGKNPLLLRGWNLSKHKLEDSRVKQIAALLGDKHCKLNKLLLRKCDITDEGCSSLTSALCSNPSHLRHLNLSGNKLGDSGIGHLCDLLRNSQFQLENLELCECSITEKQCDILTSALCSNPSHLRELNLSGNKLENTGLNHICHLLNDSNSKLEKLILYKCGITDVASLTEVKTVRSLKKLDLRKNRITQSSGKKLREVLKNSGCELELDSQGWIQTASAVGSAAGSAVGSAAGSAVGAVGSAAGSAVGAVGSVFASGIKLLSGSKTQDRVESTSQEENNKSPTHEGTSKGDVKEDSEKDPEQSADVKEDSEDDPGQSTDVSNQSDV